VELGKVVGTVVSTAKDAKIEGRKLLIVNLVTGDGKLTANHVVAIDTVGAGLGELVICVRGSSARMAKGMETVPTDTSIVGIVDTLEYKGKVIFQKFTQDIDE
jgi:ethanolamine utilization protein EutN